MVSNVILDGLDDGMRDGSKADTNHGIVLGAPEGFNDNWKSGIDDGSIL